MKRVLLAVALIVVSSSSFAGQSPIRSEIESGCIFSATKSGVSKEQAKKRCRCYFEAFANHLSLSEWVTIKESDSPGQTMASIIGSRSKLIKSDTNECLNN